MLIHLFGCNCPTTEIPPTIFMACSVQCWLEYSILKDTALSYCGVNVCLEARPPTPLRSHLLFFQVKSWHGPLQSASPQRRLLFRQTMHVSFSLLTAFFVTVSGKKFGPELRDYCLCRCARLWTRLAVTLHRSGFFPRHGSLLPIA